MIVGNQQEKTLTIEIMNDLTILLGYRNQNYFVEGSYVLYKDNYGLKVCRAAKEGNKCYDPENLHAVLTSVQAVNVSELIGRPVTKRSHLSAGIINGNALTNSLGVRWLQGAQKDEVLYHWNDPNNLVLT